MEKTASPNRPRQLVVGLDAMEWDLVKRWAGAGKMPTFRRLMDEGMRAELKTTSAQLPDTVWASIYTGTNPAKFQKYFYVQYDPKTAWLKHVPDDEIHGTPFWDYLSEAGRTVGVADVPKFPLSRRLNGFQLTNWGAHATKTARASSPEPLLGEIESRFGKHPVADCDKVDDKPAARRLLRQQVLDGVRLHGEVFRWLMRERSWDVFFGAFSAPHCIGHHFWHYVDPTHPRHRQADPDGLADTVEQVYRAIDREIGEMIALAGPGARVMVVAGHGMGPIYHASWNLPELLDLMGYGAKPATAAGGSRKAKVNPWRVLKMVLPGKLQYAIKNALPRKMQDELLFLWYAGGQKYEGRRGFAVPNNDSVGAIRLSVKGRDKNGVVEPGSEYRAICRDIAAALQELTDPATGRRVVRQVTLSAEEFQGPYLDNLPDLTVLWEQTFAWHAIRSPRFGELQIPRQDGRSGSHTPHGFVLAKGAEIAAGLELTGRSIYDIAPSVLEAAGVPIPEHMDGQPLMTQRAMTA